MALGVLSLTRRCTPTHQHSLQRRYASRQGAAAAACTAATAAAAAVATAAVAAGDCHLQLDVILSVGRLRRLAAIGVELR